MSKVSGLFADSDSCWVGSNGGCEDKIYEWICQGLVGVHCPRGWAVCFFKTLEISTRVHSILSWKTVIFIQSGVGIDYYSISENGLVIYDCVTNQQMHTDKICL